ncbi:non-ribosomal peptide synthetase, partial [Denitromonas iodatirespirans]
VRLDAFPLTPNGKLDRKALPAPDEAAYVKRAYEAPQGEVEETLAQLWRELLGVEQVGRQDNFFELGGHSLMAVSLIERLRQAGLYADVRGVFAAPSLSELAATLKREDTQVEVPANLITEATEAITPDLLPLVELSQSAIDRIVAQVPGGVRNVQDIYPLTAAQEGILFHHLLAPQTDAYVEGALFAFGSRARLDSFLAALQGVIDRHDILRTLIAWQGLDRPMQVVLRQVSLPCEQIVLDPALGEGAAQLEAQLDPARYHLDVSQAPLLRCFIAHDVRQDRWLLRLLSHHIAIDHTTQDILIEEAELLADGRAEALTEPVPFRNFVAQARFGVSEAEHVEFFTRMLADIDEPSAPFGMLDIQGDGSDVREAQQMLDPVLSAKIRAHARSLGISAASLMHLAWALVVARTTGREDVVFGTVLFGRMQGGAQADRVMGMFINTLPVRLRIDGRGIRDALRSTHETLVDLIRHEHAPLSLAQRCSGVDAPAPLFTSLFNYRYSASPDQDTAPFEHCTQDDIQVVSARERTNYPLTVSVDDLGSNFMLTAQVVEAIAPARVCRFMATALQALVVALDAERQPAACLLDVLPAEEHRQVIHEWNDIQIESPAPLCLHQVFEAQVAQRPGATAVVFGETQVSYGQLNAQANLLARTLVAHGVQPNDYVAICMGRGVGMIVAMLATLKAGGAYVPLDPAYASDRLAYIAENSAPKMALVDAVGSQVLAIGTDQCAFGTATTVINLDDLDAGELSSEQATENLELPSDPGRQAYVIYTSGSTGQPKGVMVTHGNVGRLFRSTEHWFQFNEEDVWTLFHSFSFDFSVWEIWGALLYGGELVVVPLDVARSPEDFHALICERRVTVLNQTPSAFQLLVAAQAEQPGAHRLRYIVFGGEALELRTLAPWFAQNPGKDTQLINMYGITETTVHVTYRPVAAHETERPGPSPIGVRIPDLKTYILDDFRRPAPVGVVGELYVGGAGVARGYLKQAELTAERFLEDPYVDGGRIYKTGDLGRWLPDGTIEYLGRNDFQVKIRGFRIELGEIEAKLAQHELVRDVVVLALDDGGGKRLVAYIIGDEPLAAEGLRAYAEQVLPAYMVPSAYVSLERFPLTPNGKLDRKALPAPDGAAFVQRPYEPPQGEVEERLAALWAELLQLELVGRHDNFFELGGHSLLAVTMIGRMRQAGLFSDVRALFITNSLAEFANTVSDQDTQIAIPANLIPDALEVTDTDIETEEFRL